MTNLIEQSIQIQRDYGGYWRGFTKSYAMTERQQAFADTDKLREIYPDRIYRLVSVAVTLLSEQGEGRGCDEN